MMELVIDPQGTICTLYTEDIDLSSLGQLTIRRASHVEPDDSGRWWVDLSPVGGPTLGPFARRSLALGAETRWIAARLSVADRPRHAGRARGGQPLWPALSPDWPHPLAEKRTITERTTMKQLNYALLRDGKGLARATA